MHGLAVFLSSALLSAAVAPPDASPIPQIKFEKYTLPNGLQVVLHEDHSTPLVGVNVWYHVGSKNERPGRTGFAHLFEHMMFQGSEHYDKDYFGPFEKAGGKINGSTSTDRTNYWETVPANYLELALWMEADRMGFLLPAMTQEKLDNQRSVVKNERRQSYENRPYGLVHEAMLAALYPAGHPYRWPVIGSMRDIDAASRADVAEFFRQYYHPGNASLCIAGDFQPAEAKRLVAKYFGPLPSGPEVKRLAPRAAEVPEEKRIRMTDRVGLARLYLTWPTVPEFAADDAELEILGEVLGGGRTSRLYRALVRRKQIAQDVHASQRGSELAGEFSIVATARAGHTLAELEQAVAEEIRRIQAEPPTPDEVTRAVNKLESHFVHGLQAIGGFGGRADRLNMYNVLTGDPGYLQEDFARLARVEPQGVMRVAKKYLGAARVVVEVTPGKEVSIKPDPRSEVTGAAAAKGGNKDGRGSSDSNQAGRTTSDGFDRSVMPGPGPEPKFTPPPIHRGRLSNGMELLVVENHQLPLVNLHAVFPAGRADDPADKPGLAALTAAVWDQGTPRRSAEQIAADLAGIGASLSVTTGWDTTSARLFSLKRQLGKALDIYADVLRNPAFPQPELERQRAMALGHLAQVRNEPLALAGAAVGQLIYGLGHPYGRPPFGTPAALRAITRGDVEDFYRRHVQPERATLIVVGDITPGEAAAQLEKVLGGWSSAGILPAKPIGSQDGRPAPAPPPRLILIDRPGAPQSVINVAMAGTWRTQPDYFPLTVTNTIFGGQFLSRLNMNLREDKGYTYGARSTLEWRVREPGTIVAAASVQTRVTAPALVEFLKELRDIAGPRPVGPDELARGQRFLVRGYPANFETSSQVAEQLETLATYRLPGDYFNTVVPKLNAVTTADVLQTAKKYFKLDRLTIVIVGDRAAIEADLGKLPEAKNLAVLQFDEDFRLVPGK